MTVVTRELPVSDLGPPDSSEIHSMNLLTRRCTSKFHLNRTCEELEQAKKFLPKEVVEFHVRNEVLCVDRYGKVSRFQPLTQQLKQVVRDTAMDYFQMDGMITIGCICVFRL